MIRSYHNISLFGGMFSVKGGLMFVWRSCYRKALLYFPSCAQFTTFTSMWRLTACEESSSRAWNLKRFLSFLDAIFIENFFFSGCCVVGIVDRIFLCVYLVTTEKTVFFSRAWCIRFPASLIFSAPTCLSNLSPLHSTTSRKTISCVSTLNESHNGARWTKLSCF